jgi:hypothetical protein
MFGDMTEAVHPIQQRTSESGTIEALSCQDDLVLVSDL